MFVVLVSTATESFTWTEGRRRRKRGRRREQGTYSQVTFAANYVKRFSRANFSIASPSWFPSPLAPVNPFSTHSLSLCTSASLGISKMWAHVSRLERLPVVSATKCIENYFFCLLKLFFELYWKRTDASKRVQAAVIALAATCLANCTATYTHWEKKLKVLTL